ncbi:tetratricopeptide repeat protein [Streptomyces rubiginosohelvolus]|uniref:tetratricopeptide repeat protein n=1 Tax=Streptomyces rubiginosohelvolus TaxID=67362 RepID=UPI0036A28E96
MKARPGGVLLHAVHGLGGIGKSSLAAHWAATRARDHGLTTVRWITADSPAAVERGLAALAVALQPAASKVLTVEALAEFGRQWLATHSGWLVVLDNVNNPADIADLLARAPGGRFLITSRLATVWHDAGTVIRLDVLDPGESLTLLNRVANPGGSRDMIGAADLCAELGQLPLAIQQAAAFLAQNPLLTPRRYGELLRQDPASMHRQGGEVPDAERTIARTWRVTLDRIGELQPAAAHVLRTLAWYAADGIPAGLLDDAAAPAAVASAIGTLNAYSMVTVDPDSRSLAVHRLLQSVARTPDSDDPHRTPELIDRARAYATTALLAAVQPYDWRDAESWPTGHTMLPHMEAVANHTPAQADTTPTSRLLNHAGVFLTSQGLGTRATPLLRRGLAHHERMLGPDHIDTLATRHNLAGAHEAAGHRTWAVSLYERCLEDAERALGATHPLTIASRNNLADAYRATGDTDKALRLLGRNIADGMPWGEDQFVTLTTLHNFACTQLSSGDVASAVRQFEVNLEACMRQLGEDHHLTLVTRHHLTAARASAGEPLRVTELFEQDLHDMERVLGEDHPDTIVARADLGYAYKEAGDPVRAVPMLERALRDMDRVQGEQHRTTRLTSMALAHAHLAAGDPDGARALGASPAPRNEALPPTRSADVAYALLRADHPEEALPLLGQAYRDSQDESGAKHRNTITGRHNLAVAHLMKGDPGQAIPLLEENLRIKERELDKGSPSTITTVTTLRHLADAHRQAGHFEQAVSLYDRTLRGLTETLGEEHADSHAVLACLAYSLHLAGRPEDAVPVYRRTLDGMCASLGPSHPETLTTRNGLAGAYKDAGDHQRAVLIYEDNLVACADALGEEHPHTLTARGNLAAAHAATRDYGPALALLEDNLPHQERVQGAGHPDTLTTRMNIASTYEAMGMRKEAVRRYKQTLSACIRALGTSHPMTRSAYAKLRSAKRRKP